MFDFYAPPNISKLILIKKLEGVFKPSYVWIAFLMYLLNKWHIQEKENEHH